MFVNIHTHQISYHKKNYLEVFNQYPLEFIENDLYFSVGIHPWKINPKILDKEFNILEQKIQHKNTILLGECGLDKIIKTDFNLQIEVFIKHINLAKKYNKPIIIHCVKSFQEILFLLKKEKFNNQVIFHGFNGNKILAEQILKKGYYLSLGKHLFLNSNLLEVLKIIPENQLFLETDSSEKSIEEIYEFVSKIKNMKITELKNNNINNFNKLLKSQ